MTPEAHTPRAKSVATSILVAPASKEFLMRPTTVSPRDEIVTEDLSFAATSSGKGSIRAITWTSQPEGWRYASQYPKRVEPWVATAPKVGSQGGCHFLVGR